MYVKAVEAYYETVLQQKSRIYIADSLFSYILFP